MLTNQFIKNINDSLSNNSFLDNEDFLIILPTEEQTLRKIIKISYTFDDSYYFKATIDTRLNFKCVFSPGKVMLKQTVDFENEEDYFNEIEEWVDRLEKEFTSSPLAKTVIQNQTNIEELKEKVDELFKEKDLNPDEKFSPEEAQKIESSLEEFKRSIEEKLESEMAEKITLRNEVKKLFGEIEFLKNQVEKLTKKNWFSSFIAKTNKFIKNNPETTKAITQTAKHLLPEEIQNVIPEETTSIIDVLIEEQANK